VATKGISSSSFGIRAKTFSTYCSLDSSTTTTYLKIASYVSIVEPFDAPLSRMT